jgi:pimeloyl-ACP methyl ester carboxylesterase
MRNNLVRSFCTPPFLPLNDFDSRVLEDADKEELAFEYGKLNCYSWGQGKKVLLVHGWGSRASHMGLIARTLAGSGFKAISYDAPAHASGIDDNRAELSNFFEFSRSLAQVAKNIGPFFAIIGHSLGAVASVFAITGKSLVSGYRVQTEKLILMGLPVHLENLVTSFCRNKGLNDSDCSRLKNDLEHNFNFSFDDFNTEEALREIKAEVLVIHDRNDEEFPLSEAECLQKSFPKIELYVFDGKGHQKVMLNRQVISRIEEWLT